MPKLTVQDVMGTPNPHALKFILSHPLVTNGSKSYTSPEGARKNPLAASLFALGDVASVFIMENFVTINKATAAEWEPLIAKIKGAIEDAEAPEVTAAPAPEAPTADAGVSGDDQGALLRRINEVLDQQIRPGLAMDGGGLQVMGLDGHTLKIHYQGACGSCPSAMMGTLYAIEGLLRDTVDPRITVQAA